MEIHFCDICNESVPELDLAEGRAFRRKGRIVCATCDAAMSPGGSPALAGAGGTGSFAARRTGVGAERAATPVVPVGVSGIVFACMLATIGLVLALGVLLTTRERLRVVEERAAGGVVALRGQLESTAQSLERDVESARLYALEEIGTVERRLDELGRSRVEELEAARRGIDEVSRSLGELAGRVKTLESRTADRSGEERLRGALEALGLELAAISERLLLVEDLAAARALEPADVPGGPPAWFGLVADLESEDAGTRWSAVQALGETGDPGVVPHVVPRLHDDDVFVRMAAARILGELGAVSAVGELIDALEDPEPSVREAALVTLRALTGRDLRFDPSASEPERARRVEAWRAWWEENAARLLDAAGSADG